MKKKKRKLCVGDKIIIYNYPFKGVWIINEITDRDGKDMKELKI